MRLEGLPRPCVFSKQCGWEYSIVKSIEKLTQTDFYFYFASLLKTEIIQNEIKVVGFLPLHIISNFSKIRSFLVVYLNNLIYTFCLWMWSAVQT